NELHVLPFAWQISANGGKDGVLAQVVGDNARSIGIDCLVVGHSGAHAVCQIDPTHTITGEQTRDAQDRVRSKCKWIDEIVVDATVDHVHSLWASSCPHIHEAIVHEQVRAFDELDAHALGQESVLE